MSVFYHSPTECTFYMNDVNKYLTVHDLTVFIISSENALLVLHRLHAFTNNIVEHLDFLHTERPLLAKEHYPTCMKKVKLNVKHLLLKSYWNALSCIVIYVSVFYNYIYMHTD